MLWSPAYHTEGTGSIPTAENTFIHSETTGLGLVDEPGDLWIPGPDSHHRRSVYLGEVGSYN